MANKNIAETNRAIAHYSKQHLDNNSTLLVNQILLLCDEYQKLEDEVGVTRQFLNFNYSPDMLPSLIEAKNLIPASKLRDKISEVITYLESLKQSTPITPRSYPSFDAQYIRLGGCPRCGKQNCVGWTCSKYE